MFVSGWSQTVRANLQIATCMTSGATVFRVGARLMAFVSSVSNSRPTPNFMKSIGVDPAQCFQKKSETSSGDSWHPFWVCFARLLSARRIYPCVYTAISVTVFDGRACCFFLL